MGGTEQPALPLSTLLFWFVFPGSANSISFLRSFFPFFSLIYFWLRRVFAARGLFLSCRAWDSCSSGFYYWGEWPAGCSGLSSLARGLSPEACGIFRDQDGSHIPGIGRQISNPLDHQVSP